MIRQKIKNLYAKSKIRGVILIYVPALEILWTEMDNRVGHYRMYYKKIFLIILKEIRFKNKKNRIR